MLNMPQAENNEGGGMRGRSRWVLLSCLAMSNLVEQFDRYLFSVSRIPFINEKSYEYALLAGTFFSIVYCVGNVFWSLLNDFMELDRVSVVALSCFISSAALFFVPFMESFAGEAMLRLIMGFAQSPITAFCSSLIKDAFTDAERGVAFGVFDSGTFLGFAVSLTLGTILYDKYGWKVPYMVLGIAGVVYAVVLRMYTKDPYVRGRGGHAFIGGVANERHLSGGHFRFSHSPSGEDGPRRLSCRDEDSERTDLVAVTSLSTGEKFQSESSSEISSCPGPPSAMMAPRIQRGVGATSMKSSSVSEFSAEDSTSADGRRKVWSSNASEVSQLSSVSAGNSQVSSQGSTVSNPHRGTNVTSGTWNNSSLGKRDTNVTGETSCTQVSRLPTMDRRAPGLEPFRLLTNPLLNDLDKHKNEAAVVSGVEEEDRREEEKEKGEEEEGSSLGQEDSLVSRARQLSGHSIASTLSSRMQKPTSLCAWVWRRIMRVLRYAMRYPSIILMCLACGIRFCGGYQYAYYLSIFFSDLYEKQFDNGDEVSCTYSYDPSDPNIANACSDPDYPYCVEGSCRNLSGSPWHNKGMDHKQFEQYFAGMTVLGSVTSCLFGGYIGDYVARNSSLGLSGRLLVSGISLLIAAPCYYSVYTLEYPACFGMIAVGGFFGEMYYGLALATLAEMMPRELFTIAVAVYLSILVAFGSNGTLLVPLVRSAYMEDDSLDYTFNLSVAPTYQQSEDNNGNMADVDVNTTTSGALPLQYSLCWLVSGCYTVAGMLFLLSIRPVMRDFARIKETREDGGYFTDEVD